MKPSVLLLILSVLVPSQLSAQSQPRMTILTEEDPPDQFRDDQGNLTGYTVELVREIQKRLGNTDPIRMAQWAGAYDLALKDPNVVIFNMNRTKAREDLFYWVGPVNEFSHGFFALKESDLSIHSLDDARKIPRIGVYKDDFRDEYLTSLGFHNLDRATSSDANIRKLLEGHIQVMVTSPSGLDLQMTNLGASASQVKALYIFLRTQSYIAISKKTAPTVVVDWVKALNSLKQDGTFQKIYVKWYPENKLPGPALPPEI